MKRCFNALALCLLFLSGLLSAQVRVVPKGPSSLGRMDAQEARILNRQTSRKSVPSEKAEGKAIVTLDIKADWGDGSGYQMLMDSDHNTFGVYFDDTAGHHMSASGGVDPSVYAEFEYKMPENASGSVSDNSWLIGKQKKSIEIEPGIYDYVVCSPIPGSKILTIPGDGVGNDFEFKAGIEYVFTITPGTINDVCTRTEIRPKDLALTAILSPTDKIDIENEEITVRIANKGSEEIASFEVEYAVNGSLPIRDTVNRALAPGEETEYTFRTSFNPEKYGKDEITARVILEGDGIAENDTKTVSVINGCDLSVEQLVQPVSGTELNIHDVEILIRNNGKKAVDSFQVSYKINRNETIVETVKTPLAGGESRTHVFATPANLLSYGNYDFLTEVLQEFDLNEENNTLKTSIENSLSTPSDPLFFCNFDDTTTQLGLWTVINANQDDYTWMYALDIVDDLYWYGGGHAEIRSNYSQASDDYLITRNPLRLKNGNHYIRFNYAAYSPYFGENLRVLYGKDPDPEKMETLSEKEGFLANSDGSYYTEAVNFPIEEEADYYFAFYAYSEKSGVGIKLDNVLIDTGSNQGAPNLIVEKVLLPLSGCGLAEETVGVRLSNNGSGNIYEYKLLYTVNGKDSVEEIFADTILMGQTKETYFKTPADLSDFGEFKIKVDASVILHPGQQPETHMRDNSGSDTIRHQDAASLPFITDFRKEEDRLNWDFKDGAWLYRVREYWITDPEYQNTIYADEEEPLVSRCVELDEGAYYRFSYEYICGTTTPISGVIPESFEIRYGLAGTPVQEWTLLKKYEDHFTDDKYVKEDLSFLCPASGQYSFAIIPITAYTTIHFKEISVEDAPAYDLRMTEFSINMPYRIPAEHIDQTFQAEYTVQNKGWEEAGNARITISAQGKELAKQELTIGGIEQESRGKADIRIEKADIGEKLEIIAEANLLENADRDTTRDNSMEQILLVTDSVMSYDQVSEEMYNYDYAIGSTSMITCGLPFEIGVADTLTGISIGWAPMDVDMEISYHIYRWDPELLVLEDLLYENTCQRGKEAGQTEYPVRPMLLTPGSYMIAVSFNNISLVADLNFDATVYTLVNGVAYPQKKLGVPAIRAIFGHGAKLLDKDASATGFSRPSASGSFSPEEMVVVKVSNQGIREEIIPVSLTVNGKLVETAKVRLGAYASGEVLFLADLSEPESTYELVAWTELEGDQKTENDTCRMTVRTGTPADPYILDFEECSDFSVNYLNPQWTTVDIDKRTPYTLDGISFPYSGTPFAFIVFNPKETSPAMQESSAIEPFNGERFGACFSSNEGSNNDWLISPKLKLPKTGAKASLEVKSYTDQYGLEKYNLLISNTGNNPSDFIMLGETRTAPAETWQHVDVDLSEYAGQEIHFAIQCVSDDNFMFMVDNIVISKPGSGNENNGTAAGLRLYPNPASTQINIADRDGEILDVDICNIMGSVLYSARNLRTPRFVYPVEGMQAGIYFARVRTGNGTAVLKFVVR